MRYDDASQASSANAEPIARADTEVLPQGSFGPATGNAISGAGTTSGANGADSVGAGPATIAAVQGAGGATGQAAGSFHALGQYGVLSMDAEGNFSYVRNPGTPDGVQDVFQYTLADAAGAQSSTTLTIDIAQVAAAQAGQGIVNLPAGVEMSDIHVNGRDLVIDMPDGTQMVIPGGAVFVPQLAIGDVEVPATNLAALLINSEPQPAAGTPQSSGGNFAVDVPPLDPGVPLGDLIPPTELSYTPPEFEELANAIDHKPTVIIITPDNPAGAVDAVANVDESGLPARGSEPEGTLASQDIESTSGTIVFVAEDGVDSITVGGVEVTAVNQVINGAHGVLMITSIDLASGQIGFSYTATDNTTDGVNDFEDFPVVVTDSDGDVAAGNLHINIADDEPIALDDTDTLDVNTLTATGNVMSGADTTSGASGKDTVGADDASLTAVSGADGSDSSFNSDGNLVVHGAYGTLTIDANGQYTYVLDDNAPDNVKDVFTYTLTDGDGDIDTATLTITIPNINEPPVVEGSAVNVSEEGLPGGNPDTSGSPDTTNDKTAIGDIGLTDADGDATTVTLGVPAGSYTSGGEAVHWAVSADGHSLVGYTGADSTANHVIEIAIDNLGAYTVTLVQPFDDPNVAIEDSITFTVPVSVNDGTETVSTSITVTVEDDAPNAVNDTDSVSGNTAAGNVVTGVGTTNGGADSYGADGPGSVTGIHAGTSGSFTGVPQDGGDVLVHGSFGDLVIHDDGSYTYTRSDNSVAGGTDVFTYQLTDGDGDTDTATLTITVPNINTTPSIGDVDDAVVDEDGLQNANVDANPLQVDPDETNSTEDASFEGEIHVDFKTDVPGNLSNAITLVDTSALDGQLQTLDGKDIVFALEGGNLVGRPDGGGDPLITISITGVTAGSGGNATYTYEVDLLGPIQHAGGTELTSSEDSVSLNGVTFTITDSNGDHATGTFDVSVVDDVPTASLSDRGVPGITLDESAAGTDTSDGTTPNGISSDTVDFSTAFATPVYGADGEGSHGYQLQLTGSNVGSGLYALDATDTDPTGGLGKGAEIMLVDNGDGTISGMVGSTEYFVISVNSATGEVTFTQEQNIWHPDTGNNDDAQSIVPDGGSLSLVQTITDGDGDTDSASVNLSGAFTIQDDGPNSVGDGEPDLPKLVVDESPLSGDGVNSDHSNFASAFADSPNYGTDGPGNTQYGLLLSADGTASGLYALDPSDTDPTGGLGKGAEIQLYVDGDNIVGKVGDTVYFTISVDNTGEVTLARNPDENLWHSDTTSADDQQVLTAVAGTIELQQTITDADGDHSSSMVDLSAGVFAFEDDGPAAVADSGNVTEGQTLTVVVADGVLANDSFGTDGPGTIVGVAHAEDTSSAVSGNVGTQIDGDYGKLTLNADGSYEYISTNGAVPPAGATDTFVYTIVDADGDSSTVTLTINLDNNNLIPVAGETSATVDDEGLPGGNPGDISNGDIDANAGESGSGSSDESVYTGQLQGTGGDSPTGFLFDAELDGDTAPVGTETIQYQVSGDGLTLTAIIDGGDRDGLTLFTVVINNAATGDYTLTLVNPVMHTDGDGVETNAYLDIPYQMQDSDSDLSASPGTLHVTFNDDVPQEFDGCPADTIGVNAAGTNIEDLSLNLPSVGGDAPGTLSFGTIQDGDPVLDNDGHQLFSGGEPLYYSVNPSDPTILEARTSPTSGDGTLVFQIDLDQGAGTYDFHQYAQIEAQTELSITDLSSIGGGNVDAKAIDVSGSPYDLILSTASGDTINTSANWIGVSGGQSLVAGDVVRVDFVQNAFVTGSGSGATLNFGEYYSANAYREDVGGLNSNQFASFTVRAIQAHEASGSNLSDPADGDNTFYGDTNDTIVPVAQLNIYDASGNLVNIAAYNASNPGGDPDLVVTDNGDGSWNVTGLPQGFDFEITSSTAFQAVEIEAISGSDTFKLGAIDITSVVEGSVDLTVPLTLTDADGDPVSCDIDINLGPAANGANVVLQVNEAGLDSVGSDPASDSETNGGDLSSVVSGGTGPYTFALTGSNSDGDSPYGHLTMNTDGTYSFTLTAPVDGSTADNGTNLVNGVVTYTYEATDSLGATTTGSITIDVRDDVPTARNDTDVIDEGDASESGNVITGDGTTTAGDSGDDTKGADGATVTAATGYLGAVGVVDGSGDITVTGQWGTLVIHPNGDYTYTLSTEGAAALEAKGAGQTLDAEVFNYTLTDGDGDQDSATLTITPTGANDNPGVNVPDTGDDTKTVYESGLAERSGEPAGTAEAADGDGTNNDVPTETVTGSFTFSDGDGASTVTINGTTIDLDGPFPLAPIAGDFGDLTITSVSGHTVNYSYTLSDNIDHSDGVPNQDDFSIVVDDSDGSNADAATDTLTIHIADDAPIADNDTDVIDQGDTSETGNVITGVGTTSGSTGDDRVGADNADVTAASHPTGGAGTVDGDGNITVTGLWGTIVIQPDGDYTYTLSTAGTAALNALGENQTLTAEVFTYTLTDSDGSTDTATLTITPMGANDNPGVNVPDTGDDTKTVYEAGLAERSGEPAGTAEAADGNGTDNDVNTETVTGTFTFTDGDGASTVTINGTTIDLDGPFPLTPIAGTYGNLTITNVVGHTVSYSYTLSDNISHNDANPNQDDFTITVDDSDGSPADAASDVLTIHIADDAPIADDDTDALVEGETSQSGNVITGAGTTSGAAGDDRVGADNATVTAATGFGGAGTVDGDGNITITGHWGTIVIQPDGDYTYTLSQAGIDALAAKGEGQTLAPETVTYTLTDTDGSTDTATLTISLTGTNDSPGVTVPDTGADTKTVYEAGLAIRGSEPAGSAEAADGNGTDNDVNSETVTGTFTFSDGDGASTITIEGSGSPVAIPLAGPFPIAVTGDYGTLTITGISGHTVSYSYTLSDNISHSDANPDQDDFTIVVDDSDGTNSDAASDTLTIHISDDGPVAAADANSVTEGALLSVNAANGVLLNDLPGADNYVAGGGVVGVRLAGGDTTTAVQTGVNTSIVGSYGTLVLQANGSYTYQANSNVSGSQTDHFVYTIKDTDGSLSTTTLDITVNDGAGPGAGGNVALTLNEFALDTTKDANDLQAGTSTGTNAAATSETQVVLQASGLHFSAGSDDITSIAFSLTNPPTVNGLESGFSISWAINGSGQMVGTLMQGVTNLGTAILVQLTGETGAVAGDTADVGVTATLIGRLEHVNPPGTQGPVTITGIEVVASQADGDSNTGTVSITVTDDTPTAPKPEAATVANDASGFDTGTLDTDDSTLNNNVGADGGIARFAHTGLPSLTSGGVTLVYEFSNNDQTLTAKAGAGGPVVFTATISGSGYTIDMNGTLDSLQHVDLNPTVSGFVGGNDPWAGFNLAGPGDILLTPTSDTGTLGSGGNTLNTSAILLGVGGGQAVDQHEGVRIDFVTNLGGNPAKSSGNNNGYSDLPNQDHTFDSEYTSNGASVRMTSESPAGGATVTAAFKAYDDNDGDNLVYHDGTQDTITGITITYLGVTYENPVTHVQMITPTSTATNYVISGHTFTVQLAADGKTVLVTGVEGDNGSSGAGTEVAVFTSNGYTSLEVINVSTDSTASFKIGSIGASVVTNDPVEFDLPVQIVDNDNDVSSTGNIHVTAGTSSSALVSSQSLTTQGFKTALAPSNDNSGSNNAALLGAVAAAGLSASQNVAAHHIDHAAAHEARIEARAADHVQTLSLSERHDAGGRSGERHDRGDGNHHDAVIGKTAPIHDEVLSQHAGNDHHPQNAPAALLQGTSAPAHGHEGGHAAVIAAAVAMPSAEQLAAVSGKGGEGQHNEVVGKVLADALQGGEGHGPNLEALINSLPGHGHGPALAALASPADGHVPHGHTAFAGVFSTGHNMLTTDHMAAHHDAPPPHA